MKVICKWMGESNTVVSAYTMHRHLQQYTLSLKCFHLKKDKDLSRGEGSSLSVSRRTDFTLPH